MGSALLAACAANGDVPNAPAQESLLPGTIGVVVQVSPKGVTVASMRPQGAAERAGLRKGDTIVRYNGTAVKSAREFNRLVLDSPPGSVAELELLRGGESRRLEMRVRQLDTMPRV